LRPPGAGSNETQFLGLCVRCGNCVRVCPSRILEQDRDSAGPAGFLAPVVRFGENYCRENCVRCMEVCPSGALTPRSLAEKHLAKIGLPVVAKDECLLNNEECALCQNACPYEAISIVFSESDYSVTPVVDAAKCTGCGACEVSCPVQPSKAIRIDPC
jgi:ferredoxin-type protein NapF